ncbi:MAG: ABC transporter ATP-binding protein [Proteobacteria bacterium]|nr:ABC transporter ATP-binding protein [Pseudomonadota bacterium]
MAKIHLILKSLSFFLKNKKIQNQKILDDIQLNILGAQTVTLLGPNGAGKSTLLKAIAAQLFCQTGSVECNGINAQKNRLRYLSNVGFMPETPLVLAELSVLEQLQLIANIKQIKNAKDAIQRVVDMCQLQKVLHKRTSHLSLGYRQRLNLAQAIINKPLLLIMDEPLNGLDPHLIIEFRNIIQQLKKDCLIIMSTHYLAEAQTISDRVLIMQNGQLLDNISELASVDLEQLYMQHTQVTV